MSSDITNLQIIPYQVTTPIYEGPLDLLLSLIEKAQLDITHLALAQITDQFLAYIHTYKNHQPGEVSEFLVIATKLIQIKSEALLPRPVIREEGEEDPGEALIQQLLKYKQFKQIANWLAERETGGFQTYLRIAPSPKVEASIDLSGITINDLVDAGRLVFSQTADKPELKTVVTPSPVTIRQQIRRIVGAIKHIGRTTFRSILNSTKSRVEVVVTFLAMLELIKRNRIAAHQDNLFSDIVIIQAEEWDENLEFDLEFDE
jgi:segregation and condensation protein A